MAEVEHELEQLRQAAAEREAGSVQTAEALRQQGEVRLGEARQCHEHAAGALELQSSHVERLHGFAQARRHTPLFPPLASAQSPQKMLEWAFAAWGAQARRRLSDGCN